MPSVTTTPTLENLPSPPSGKAGFPWTEQSEFHPNDRQDITSYPRISIITASYNHAPFIEETIRSVLLQGYPNLEYIIIDGSSTDNTLEILQKYEHWITYWVSEPDCGQTHAINKGIAKATGEVLAYLNSDDYYLPGTLFKVAEHFRQFPQTDLLHGRCRYVNEQDEKIGEQFGDIKEFEEIINIWEVWWKKRQFVQPEVFWTKRITDKIGFFNEALNYVMDYEYWCRILQVGGIVNRIDSELACFRFTNNQKSNHSEQVADELLKVVHPLLWDDSTPLPLKKRWTFQGHWLYQTAFLKQIEQSVQKRERKTIRWLKSINVILHHPQILLLPSLRTRTQDWFIRLIIKSKRSSSL